jgi:hypothetical protein
MALTKARSDIGGTVLVINTAFGYQYGFCLGKIHFVT